MGVGVSDWGLPVYIGADFMVHEDISIGARLTYVRDRENRTIWGYGQYTLVESYVYPTVNGDFHFNNLIGLTDDLDLYAGLGIGFSRYRSRVANYQWLGDNTAIEAFYNESNVPASGGWSSDLYSNIHIGGRYFLNQKVAIQLELGTWTAYYTDLGVTIMLK